MSKEESEERNGVEKGENAPREEAPDDRGLGEGGDPEVNLEKKARAFAAKLIALAEIVPAGEGVDMVNVRTIEVCRAMGRPEGAKLEEVRKFVYKVLEFLRGRDLYTACGCGYLSLMIAPAALRDKAFAENRDLTSYTPGDIETYLKEARRGG